MKIKIKTSVQNKKVHLTEIFDLILCLNFDEPDNFTKVFYVPVHLVLKYVSKFFECLEAKH